MGRKKFKEYGVGDVLTTMEYVVAEFGEHYVYIRPENSLFCQYVHDDQPGCIVGQVLVRLGAPLNTLKSVEAGFIRQHGHGLGVKDMLAQLTPTWGTLGFTLTPEAVGVLSAAQNAQDVGNTWGVVLEAAKQVAEELEGARA